MNMINGLKVKQWSFKFGTSKDSAKSGKSSVNGKVTNEKKVYQREVVTVNGTSAGKSTVIHHEIKLNTDTGDKASVKASTKNSHENGACVTTGEASVKATTNNSLENGACVTIADKDLKSEDFRDDRPSVKSNETEILDAVKELNNPPSNVEVESENIDTCDKSDIKDKPSGPGEASLGKVNDRTDVEVDSDLSDDDDCLSDSHGLNICHYKLKRMALDQNKMNHSKVHVDESEPTGYEEPPFESRDVKIRNGCWITDEYDISDILLGRGKFGEVKQCKERKTGRDLAAKFIEIQGPQDRFDVINEIEMMKSLQHPRLLQLYDVFSKRNHFCLVLELISGGELFERVINDDFILTEKACIMFMRQICEGIEFMHNNSILHLDLKPENILCLTREGNRIKIIDFGLARKYDPQHELRILFGTPEFMAPEQANFEPIYPSTDMWSVGIICYILLSGLSPFLGESENETMANITEAKWDFNAEEFNSISAEAKDFISKLILKDHTKRFTVTECLEHKWLRRSSKRERLPTRSLSTKRLRKFVYRRKWQKAVNAMLALKRMGVKL